MKRPYKLGDWFRVPLEGERDAIGVIARACRSRLFGYFFAIDAAHTPAFDELKTLTAADAAACALFGGAGLEESRWTVIATSVPFDPAAWPFPQFASRGVFGRTWNRLTYDPETMSVERREPVGELEAIELPDARFATQEELETFLLARICEEAPAIPLCVCEIRPPVDATQLQLLTRGGRVQFSEPLSDSDLHLLASFIAAHPQVELRVHGFASFDVRTLASFGELRSLVLDVGSVRYPEALAELESLEAFHLGPAREPVRLHALQALPGLHRVELRGDTADVRGAARLEHLRGLALIDAPPIDLSQIASAPQLRSLVLAHAAWNLEGLRHFPALERLSLRDMQLAALPDFAGNTSLHALELRDIRLLKDLTPLKSAPALCELRLEGLPQLHVWDFQPLLECGALRNVTVDIGSKTKSREIYKLLRTKAKTPA